MNRCALCLLVVTSFLFQTVFATMYECTYKTDQGFEAVSSFNLFHKHRKDYAKLYMAYKIGNCKELYVKRYFLEGASCNIQFYKSNMKIAGLACANNKKEAMIKLKEIARKDFGYLGK